MYLKSIHIKNIRGIEDFKMDFPEAKEAGWHVLLGQMVPGKTTVLRAIALALIGPTEILRLDHLQAGVVGSSGANEIESTISFKTKTEWEVQVEIALRYIGDSVH
ncbi:MAG: AAA family ATPase [Bacteroidetes bacterium]|nr:AAA family ATPase [Bacteroidota bacterium]